MGVEIQGHCLLQALCSQLELLVQEAASTVDQDAASAGERSGSRYLDVGLRQAALEPQLALQACPRALQSGSLQ